MSRTKKRSSKGRKSNIGGGIDKTKEEWRQLAMRSLREGNRLAARNRIGDEAKAKQFRDKALEFLKKSKKGSTTTTRAVSSQRRGGSRKKIKGKKGKTHRRRHRKSRK